MKETKEKLESAWSDKCKSLERANDDAEHALRLQTKRQDQTRDAHDHALEMLRTEMVQATNACRDAKGQLEHMTLQRDEWQDQCAMLKNVLKDLEAKCNLMVDRVSELEQSNEVHYSELQEAMNKLRVAREEADAVKKDYSALVEASDAKDNALRSELSEVHRRAAANDRAANDELTRERRDREKEFDELRMEIFALRETSAERDDRLQLAEQLRDRTESMMRILEAGLDSSKARELEALDRVDQIMKDFSEETSILRSKVTELTHSLREVEESRLDIGQRAKSLESQMQQEERAWQNKYMDLQRQLQTAEEEVQVQSQMASAATSQAQSVIQQLRQMNFDLKDFVQELQEELYRQIQLHREVHAFKLEVSKRDGMLLRKSYELSELKSEQEFLKNQNDKLVEEMAARDTNAGLEGFARGVEACQTELRIQVCF
jgi:chromosome segregation ATPase